MKPAAGAAKAIERTSELEKRLRPYVCGKYRLVRTLHEMDDIAVVYWM